jgi:hypothetical protein
VSAITPDDLERATWHQFMHAYAADHSLYVLRCSLSPRLTREFKIYRGKREPRLEGPTPLNVDVYKIDGEVVAYDPERMCELLNRRHDAS